MARKREHQSNALKYVCAIIVAVLLAMRMGMVGSTGTLIVGWVVVASVALTLVWVLWAVGQQFLFSFGKSRYPTRTERKRMQHQKKTGRDDKTEILERKIPEQRDR